MKKVNIKVVIAFILGIGLIFNIRDVDATNNYTNYKVGDSIEVRLNNQQTGKFYVTENSDSNTEDVTAIYAGGLGDEVKHTAGREIKDCKFEDTNIYTELMNRTSNWTNIKTVTMPTASQVLGQQFDEKDINSFEDILSKNGGTDRLDKISTAAFYALNLKDQYWTSSVVTVQETSVTASSDSECAVYMYGSYLLNDGTYLITNGGGAFSGFIRPLITVSKNNIVKPEVTSKPVISNNNSKYGSQTVKVGNTAKGKTIIILVVAIILLSAGGYIIYKVIKDNKTTEDNK